MSFTSIIPTTSFTPFASLMRLGCCLCSLFFAVATHAEPADRAENFVLLDQRGQAHELHYLKDQSAIALMAYSAQVASIEGDLKSFNGLSEQYGTQGVSFFLIDSDTRDTRNILGDKTLPTTLLDESQLVAERLGLTKLGETVLVDPKSWQIVYRGPIGKGGKGTDGLSAALAGIVAGNISPSTIAMPSSAPAIAYGDHSTVASYSNDIAPLLEEKCVTCHQEGGIGPWAMNNYTMIKGFAPMIREVVLTKRMPPWHADPHVNSFREDMSLSIEQQQMLVGWINAGSPRGEGDDPLLNVKPSSTEWVLGEPDLVIELPSFDVPATGSVDYQFFETANPLDKDVWVRAIQIVPGDRTVLHHAISTFGEPENPAEPIKTPGGDGGATGGALLQQQLMTFVPGNEHYVYPEGTALLLPKASSLFTQMHYTTSGKAATDSTKIGLYFSDKAPTYLLQHQSIINPFLQIPPNVPDHEETAYFRAEKDLVVYSLFPHAHYRGRSSKFTLRYPDGTEELLLSVPNYDFNWQRYFQLSEPLEVPAGSVILHSTTFDNSAQSDTNPDPTQTVAFGLQSWEEMLYGGVSYRFKEPSLEPSIPNLTQFQAKLFMSSLDKNLDAKLEIKELPERMQKQMAPLFGWTDLNRSNGLEIDELVKMFEFRNKQEGRTGPPDMRSSNQNN